MLALCLMVLKPKAYQHKIDEGYGKPVTLKELPEPTKAKDLCTALLEQLGVTAAEAITELEGVVDDYRLPGPQVPLAAFKERFRPTH